MSLKGIVADLIVTAIFVTLTKLIIWVFRTWFGWSMDETTCIVVAVWVAQVLTMKMTIFGLDQGGWLRRRGSF